MPYNEELKKALRQYIASEPESPIQLGGGAKVDYTTSQPHPLVSDSVLQASLSPSVTFGDENFNVSGEPRFNYFKEKVDLPPEWGGDQSSGTRGFEYGGGKFTANIGDNTLSWEQRPNAADSFNYSTEMLGGELNLEMTPEEKAAMARMMWRF